MWRQAAMKSSCSLILTHRYPLLSFFLCWHPIKLLQFGSPCNPKLWLYCQFWLLMLMQSVINRKKWRGKALDFCHQPALTQGKEYYWWAPSASKTVNAPPIFIQGPGHHEHWMQCSKHWEITMWQPKLNFHGPLASCLTNTPCQNYWWRGIATDFIKTAENDRICKYYM